MTKKIKEKFSNINKLPKNIIKYGFLISYLLIILGTCILLTSSDNYTTFVSREFIKSSFAVLAEVIIGGLFLDLVIQINK